MKKLNNLVKFLNKSYTAFHAVKNIEEELLKNDFIKLNENKPWNLEVGKNYYIIRNTSSIIAFKLPSVLDNKAFQIVASHSDSPTYKVKPNGSIKDIRLDYSKINTEPYGGMIASTWLDRPLGIAGRIVKEEDGVLKEEIVALNETVIIPNVAIHLNRSGENQYNPQVDMLPLLGDSSSDFKTVLAKNCGENVVSHDLFLYNKEEAMFVGSNNEYLSSGRIDDLECAYASIESLIKSQTRNISVACVFNHEEVGSRSNNGAASTFLKDTLNHIMEQFNLDKYATIASSFIISSDNAHAVHPNHPEKSDPTNSVLMNKGIVVKHQAGLSYTTDSVSEAVFKHICKKANVECQDYTNRSDTRGGSTLGAISLGHVSIHSVDIGLAQLAMHSIYETTGTKDYEYLLNALQTYFESKIEIDEKSIKII